MRSSPKRVTEARSARMASGPSASARAAGRPPAPHAARLRLRLYIAGEGPNSKTALANLRQLLAAHGPADYDLEVVDCLREPLRALRDGVLVTPTLMRIFPGPVQTIVGTLSRPRSVYAALGLSVPPNTLEEASDD